MTIANILNKSLKTLKSNSPEILTGLGVTGVIGTAYLAARSAFKATAIMVNEALDEDNEKLRDPETQFKEAVKLTWKCYIPPVASGAVTVACIIGASHTSGRRTAAAIATYSLTQKAFDEYKEHVIEQIGKGKEQKVRDQIAQDRVTKNPPSGSKELVIIGSGQVLCCELYTGRYFKSDMDTLCKAQNQLNALLVSSYQETLEEFYDILDLDHTSDSDKMGWDSDKLLELEFSSVLAPSGEPCLAFAYNYIRLFG